MQITWDDFQKVDLRLGTIIEATEFPEAHNPSYKVKIDFGTDIGIKKSSAQITVLYNLEDLLGKQVLAVVNFPPKQIGPFMSECLITGFHNENGDIALAMPEFSAPNGAKLI